MKRKNGFRTRRNSQKRSSLPCTVAFGPGEYPYGAVDTACAREQHSLVMPMPPTVNHYKQKAVNRRTGKQFYFLSEDARRFFAECKLWFPHWVRAKPDDLWFYEVAFVFHYVRKPRVQDADNRLKALQDMISANAGINDSRCLGGSFRGLQRQGRSVDYCLVRVFFFDNPNE